MVRRSGDPPTPSRLVNGAPQQADDTIRNLFRQFGMGQVQRPEERCLGMQ